MDTREKKVFCATFSLSIYVNGSRYLCGCDNCKSLNHARDPVALLPFPLPCRRLLNDPTLFSTRSLTDIGGWKNNSSKTDSRRDEIFEEEMVKTVWVSRGNLSNRSHLGIITAFHGRLVMSHAMCASWGRKRQTAGKRGHIIASNIRT